jgi:hypothetical protein
MTYASLGYALRAVTGAALLLCTGLAAATAQGATERAADRAAGGAVVLAPHRATYELTLSAARSLAGVTSVAGRMVYDLTGSPCEGYTQNMRFVTRMVHQSGSTSVTDLRSSTWEDAVAKRFRFDSTQRRDDRSTETTAGDATRLGAGEEIKVDISKPAKRTISLPAGAYFPIQHTIALIRAARAGKASFRADLYDGAEKGEKVYDTVSALGRVQPPGGNRRLAPVANAEPLDGFRAWPVSIAYFEPGSERKDALPVYEISFLMFDNGVSRKLKIDYGDFALQGELTQIVFHEPSKCDQK